MSRGAGGLHQPLGDFETTVEGKVKALESRLEDNKWNITMLTHTTVYLRNKDACTLQTWEVSNVIRVAEMQELMN